MKNFRFIWLLLLSITPLFGMEKQQPKQKKAKADVQDELLQPESLKNITAGLVFYLLPQQTQLEERFDLLAKDIIGEYINKPIDQTGRTPTFFATPENIPIMVARGAQLNLKDNIEHTTCIEYFLTEGKCNAAAKAIEILFKDVKNYGITRIIFVDNVQGEVIEPIPYAITLTKDYPTIFRKFYTLVEKSSEKIIDTEYDEIFGTNPEKYFSRCRYNSDVTFNIVRILRILGKYEDKEFFERTLTDKTALHLAQSPEEIQQALIHSLADLHSQDIWGNTPFMYQVKHNRPHCALALLRAGADVLIPDAHERDPLEYAKMLGHRALIASYETKDYIIPLLESADEDNFTDLEDENI